ncbi:hypothetical protein B0H17DRAFT_1132323 [Mycena rosella]|uniref:CxC2-like cysteine cluster KDZ transposase-associated domain-containing protein n=1 Tax=Mycena rosella TaxID=1033263 RepID=A0AAD7DL91_MYCRO|nr:hypothetical protein B0H17DRAFT_1132323 [Mycena rosella]
MSRMGRPRKFVDIDVDEDDYLELTADRGIYFSRDGERRTEELLNVAHKKRRLEPTKLNDGFGEWIPMPNEDFSEEGAHEPPQETQDTLKRKEYISTTDPMSLFRPLKAFFLDELLRHEGLGDDMQRPACAHCKKSFSPEAPIVGEQDGDGDGEQEVVRRMFKCYKCGEFLQCESCCLLHHARTPLHVIKEWNGDFWVPCTLKGLGLVYQLGHGGFPCPFPDDTVYRMVIIEAPIIHQIHVHYCECQKSDSADNLEQLLRNGWYPATIMDPGTCATFRSLEGLRLYSVVGNMNTRDFITALERVTDSTASSGMTWLPVSTCIAFAALLQKDTRMTEGLRVSGVGGCVCAQHECMRPNDLGDLQKGERLPKSVRFPMDKVKIQYALPVWHAASHNEDCQNANSLSFKPGIGKSDGEGVERVWSGLNPVALSTKDAGTGQRADVFEGKLDNHNWLKNVGEGEALQRKLVVAITERDRQIQVFAVVNSTVSKSVKKVWKTAINDWLEDETKPNPFMLERKGVWYATAGEYQLKHANTDCPTEAELGCRLRTCRTVLVAADRENKIQEWRHTLLVKIAKFRSLQKIYMPGAAGAIVNAEAERDPDAAPPKPERIKLWMPSEMKPVQVGDVVRGCVRGLVNMEAKIRVGQCNNSLVSLRSRLYAKRFLIGFRNENAVGQVSTSRAGTLIGQVGERVATHAKRYRRAREALIALKGEEDYPYLRRLEEADVTLDGDWGESDTAARKKLGMLGSGWGARAPRNAPGTSKRVMSWIWTAPGALDDHEARLHDSIRVEWARARARKWLERVEARTDVADEVASGVRAYALKQTRWHERLGGYFRTKWNISALTAAQQLVAEEADLDDFFGPELAPLDT